MRSRILPFLYAILMLFLGTQYAYSQSGAFETNAFASPSANAIIGNANVTFELNILNAIITDSLDYVDVFVFPQGDTLSAAALTQLGTPGTLNQLATNEQFLVQGNDINVALGGYDPGNYYTIQVDAYTDDDGVGGGATTLEETAYIDIYVDVNAPTISAYGLDNYSVNNEPRIGGDTLRFNLQDDFLEVSNDDFVIDLAIFENGSTDTTYQISGTIATLITDGVLIDTTKNDSLDYDFTFLLDITEYVPSSSVSVDIDVEVTDGANNNSLASQTVIINDNTPPAVQLLTIDGAAPNFDVVPNANTGVNTLIYDVRDTYLSEDSLRDDYNFDLTLFGDLFSGTIEEHEDAGRLTVQGDTLFIFNVNLKPYTQSNGTLPWRLRMLPETAGLIPTT